jgi:hypothetical protein
MNTELLLKVKEAILREPEHFDMADWFRFREECGTTACIAGWAISIGRNCDNLASAAALADLSDVNNWFHGQLLLELEFPEAERLFMWSEWPLYFRSQYINSETNASRALIAADRIDQFIATNGAE